LVPERSLKNGHSYEAIRPGVRLGDGGREERIKKKNANGMTVFPGGLRMYHQQHFNWRKTLQKVNRAVENKRSTNKERVSYEKHTKTR